MIVCDKCVAEVQKHETLKLEYPASGLIRKVELDLCDSCRAQLLLVLNKWVFPEEDEEAENA